MYHDILIRREADLAQDLAVHEEAFLSVFEAAIGQLLLDNQRLKLIAFDRQQEVIVRWLP